ncbi:MAG: UDP-N-acetylmuramate dehydrogenase [Lachnospiraceae bacterium]|nr:UDP-N-acetylmuramate dehydrogenase [Lachnospiraceae bacterium]
MSDIERDLKSICGSEAVKLQEPLKNHTTFRIGGPAAFFVSIDSEEKLQSVVKYCRDNAKDYYILGNGSNMLVSDEGFSGVVIQLFDKFNDISIEGERIYARAGALLSRIANAAAKAGLTGLEAAAGIPGTLGGAMVMNAGAYGFEMKDVTEYVRVLTPEGHIKDIACRDMDFGYRHSCVTDKGYIVLGAGLVLKPGKEEDIRERMKELKEQRSSKQPLEYPSAGSTFKRPEGYFAGKLIMDAGLKGLSVGGAQVSEKHCGFVINRGDATAADVTALIKIIQDTVKEQTGVILEPEIKKLGF